MLNIVLYITVGLVSGILGGLLGIGGGIIIIPAFIYIFGMSQHMAQGTTLALMVPPIGLLAAWTYYNHGDVNLKVAAFVCIGFFIGGLLGAKLAAGIPEAMLRKTFGIAMLAIALQMIFGK
jgi:uncharacterized membrane protein YfcA